MITIKWTDSAGDSKTTTFRPKAALALARRLTAAGIKYRVEFN